MKRKLRNLLINLGNVNDLGGLEQLKVQVSSVVQDINVTSPLVEGDEVYAGVATDAALAVDMEPNIEQMKELLTYVPVSVMLQLQAATKGEEAVEKPWTWDRFYTAMKTTIETAKDQSGWNQAIVECVESEICALTEAVEGNDATKVVSHSQSSRPNAWVAAAHKKAAPKNVESDWQLYHNGHHDKALYVCFASKRYGRALRRIACTDEKLTVPCSACGLLQPDYVTTPGKSHNCVPSTPPGSTQQ
jgi:hypothetical protein